MQRKFTSLPFTEYEVADLHFDTSRLPITKIVLHSSASTKQGLIDTFAGGTRMVSAHYGIDNDGSILAFLEEYNTAYACGDYPTNQCTISVEHVDNGATVRLHTDAQYNTSIKLVADICKFYGIPADSTHIVPHSSIVATACPNGLDVDRIINGVKLLLSPVPQITDQTKLPIIDENGNQMEVQAVRSRLADYASQITSLKLTVGGLNASITTLQTKIDNTPVAKPDPTLKSIHDIYYGKNFWWTKWSAIGKLLPK